MSSSQQQPRQWFRFGSFFQQPQPRPSPPTPTPTQQPAIRPPILQPRQNAPQGTPRPAGGSSQVTIQRFPVTPTPVSAPAPKLGSLPSAGTTTPIPQPTQTVRPGAPQARPLAFQSTPRVETQPGLPTQPLGTSNEATFKRSVIAPFPPSAPSKAETSPRSPPPRFSLTTTATTVPSLQLQPSEKTNASTPYSSPMSTTPPSMQTSPSKKASPGTVSIRSSSLPTSPDAQSYSPPPYNTFPSRPSNQSQEYVKPMSESTQFRQASHNPSPGVEQAEQKNVLVQETLEKSRLIPGKQDVHDQKSMETTKNKNGKTPPKKLHDAEKSGTRIILAGVNKGAIMDLSNNDKKESSSFRGIGKKLGSVLDNGKEETKNPNMLDKNHKQAMSMQSSSIKAFINNNIQGINNSIVFNSSCTTKDPGVHLRFSRKGNLGTEENVQKDHSK